MTHPEPKPLAPLRDVNLRLGRAEEHLDALREQVRSYLENRPYVPVVQNEAQLQRDLSSGAVARWAADPPGKAKISIMATEVRPVPSDVGLTAGDFIHNLRSALDHLAWQMVT